MASSHFPRHAGRASLRVRRPMIAYRTTAAAPAPPQLVEYAYYVSVLYAVAAVAFGVSVPFLGVVLSTAIAGFCVVHLGSTSRTVYWPILPALLCAVSSLVVQLSVHHESMSDGYVRGFVTWIPSLITVQSLTLRRGFLNRFALATFAIGLIALGFGQTWSGGGVDRLALDDSVSLNNPNDLAGWFGFCAVYFVVLGLETRRGAVRIGAWGAGLLSIYVVGLTVSRGKLAAVAIAIVIALRRKLRRSFLPVLF